MQQHDFSLLVGQFAKRASQKAAFLAEYRLAIGRWIVRKQRHVILQRFVGSPAIVPQDVASPVGHAGRQPALQTSRQPEMPQPQER